MAKWRDEKKRYKQYKARKEQLPASYHEAIDAVERYALRFGPATGETVVRMLEDLVEIFEQGTRDGTPVREIVGDDPVQFTEDFLKSYPASPRAAKEQQRLALTITTRHERRSDQMTNQLHTPAIRVQGLEKSFKDLHVLRGVDLEIARGSIFALLGSNGSGKTTTVKILSTLLKADAGTVTVNGYDVATQGAQVRESISLTGQFAAVDEILTGRENLVLVAQLRHQPDPGRIADELLARFSLTDAGGRKAATYSGGMRRRLDIAMSLIGNPPAIFLDEPTTGLDPQARLEVWDTIRGLAVQGTTVLLTTQYLDEAEQLADRIAILHEGTIIVNGTLAELKRLHPPAKVEYVEKQPSLEDIFLAITGSPSAAGSAAES